MLILAKYPGACHVILIDPLYAHFSGRTGAKSVSAEMRSWGPHVSAFNDLMSLLVPEPGIRRKSDASEQH